MKMCLVNSLKGDYMLFMVVSEKRKALGTKRNPQSQSRSGNLLRVWCDFNSTLRNVFWASRK